MNPTNVTEINNNNNKSDKIENKPTQKVTIKEDDVDYYEIEKNKDYIISKFGGTQRTLLSTIISSVYTLIFIILLIYYNEKHYDEGEDFSLSVFEFDIEPITPPPTTTAITAIKIILKGDFFCFISICSLHK